MKLYITNLSFDTTEAKLQNWFERGKVTTQSVFIARDAEGNSNRYGFVHVSDIDAPAALKLTGKFLGGEPVRIKKATLKKA